MPKPKEDRTQVAELPPQLAKMVLERETAGPAAPAGARAKVEKKPKSSRPPTPTRRSPTIRSPRRVKQPVPEARDPEPNKPPGESKAHAARPRAWACWR